jgi:hypothetical protein
VAGEVASGREAADVTDMANDDCRGQRADPVNVSDRGPGRNDHHRGAFANLDACRVEHFDLGEQLVSCGDPFQRDRTIDDHFDQQFFCFGDRQRPAAATLDQQTQQGMQPADRAGSVGGDLMIPIGQQAQHDPMLIETGDDVQRRVVPGDNRC